MYQENFRELLKSEFINRCKRNPKYSLRAFSKAMSVDQSLLSKIFLGKRKVSKSLVLDLAPKLGFTTQEIDSFIEDGNFVKNDFHSLDNDLFRIIADWYHFAILELFQTDCKSISPKIVSRIFGIEGIEASQAFERLQRVGLIKKNKKKWTIEKKNNSWYNKANSSLSRKNLQKSLLAKAIESIDKHDFAERDNSSLTVACSREQLPDVRERITKFRRSLNLYLEKQTKKTEVYQLVIAFYPLTLTKRKDL